MSLRKITTLLLLAAFALTQVPVQAAGFGTNTTLPNVIVDAGTAADGANRDVVPVTIQIDNITGTELIFQTYTGGAADIFTVLDNGMLSTVASTASQKRVLIISPPTGTEFVGLSGFTSAVTTTLNNTANGDTAFINTSSIDITQLPHTLVNDDSAILAQIITETASPVAFGTTVVPKGSIVVYFVTNQTAFDENPTATTFDLQNIGLAVPAGTTVASPLVLDIIDPTTTSALKEAIPTFDPGDTLAIATATADPDGQIAVALDTTEPDNQSNAVLADLLATASSTVKVNTNAITSNTVNQATLYVDTDALLIQAGETPASTVMTPVYYDTPFNTSSFLSSTVNGGSAAILNAALTSVSFPNSANALITVTYSLVPLTGNGTTDATLVINAASVSLMDQGTSEGFLGSLINAPLDVNGAALTEDKFAVSVLYNGVSTTGNLPVIDFDSLDDATTSIATVDASVGFNIAAPADVLARTDATGTPFVNNGGNLITGVFPGVDVATADDLSTTATVSNGNSLTNVVKAAGFAGATAGEVIWVQDEVTARLLPTGGNAIFAFTGNEAADDLSTDINDVKIGPTNFGVVPYNQGATLASSLLTSGSVRNNLIAVANLSGNIVRIMPLVNKVDSSRDVIKVRPEATITLGTASKAAGVKLIATVTGNNIAGSQVVEIARINAAGSTNVDATVRALPASGQLDSLLAENGTDSSTLRVAVDINTLTNVTTNDEISDLVANGSVLDDTLPSLFCGGTAGTVTNGPNSVPQQPFARTILVEETSSGAFDEAFVGGGNDVIRFTLPVGVDLVKTSATANLNDVTVISTSGGATVGAFSVAPAVVDYQTISEQLGGQAFIDVSYSAAQAGTSTIKKAIGLIFGQLSLVVPEGQTDLDVTVTIVNDDGTSVTTSDTVLDTVGTAALASGCSEQFTIAYCTNALADFGSASGPIEQDAIDNGSLLTSFSSDVSSGIRLINTDTTAFRIPDICVVEATPDALFAGASATTPNIFGGGETISLALNDLSDTAANAVANNDVIGFAGAGSITQSDDSLTMGAPAIAGSILNATFGLGTGTDEFSETTTLRFTGITLTKTASNFQPALQKIAVFTNDGTNHIATSMPAVFVTRGDNGTALLTTSTNQEESANTFFNGNNIADGTGTLDADSGDFTNGEFLSHVFGASSDAPMITASRTINDSASTFDQLSEDTKLSIAVDDIEAVTNGLAAFTRITVFTSGGDLEPGSMINVSASSGDFVNVPVTDGGNFIAQIRGEQGDTLVITQTPGSDQAATVGSDQVVVVEAQNQNLEPTLLSAVATDLAFGTITAKGDVPVLFTITAVGRDSNGDTFMPTASQLKVGVNTVYAVPGTTNKFLSVVNFFKTNGKTVTATVDGTETSVVITGLTTDFPSLGGRPVLRKVKANKSETKVQFKGSRLRNNGFGYFVLSDGTTQTITFRKRNKTDSQKSRVVSDTGVTIPSNARYAVYHTPGRGISSLDISN